MNWRLTLPMVLLGLLCGCVERVQVVPPIEVCSHVRDLADREVCETKVRNLAGPTSPGATSDNASTRAFPVWGVMLWWGIYYGFGLVIARFIYLDARSREWLVLRIRPIFWAAICIVDPAFGLLCYWLVHYSRLAPRFPGTAIRNEGA